MKKNLNYSYIITDNTIFFYVAGRCFNVDMTHGIAPDLLAALKEKDFERALKYVDIIYAKFSEYEEGESEKVK